MFSNNLSENVTQEVATEMIESLRYGTPPVRYPSSIYSGETYFFGDELGELLNQASRRGIIRFISANYGNGKSHFLRMLEEQAFEHNFLVSMVEISNDQTPFNKFEQVFSSIVREITSPEMYQDDDRRSMIKLRRVLNRHIEKEATDGGYPAIDLSKLDQFLKLMNSPAGEDLDIDFKRAVIQYWQTYKDQSEEESQLIRDDILQWLLGEGRLTDYRNKYRLSKMVDKQTSTVMLRSLCTFSRLIGYSGLMILFDEAASEDSNMKRSDLKEAHSNLLHLLNSIDQATGLFAVYATTPDFFDDPNHGIILSGPLAGRIGVPDPENPSTPLDRIWNLNLSNQDSDNFLEAAGKIADVFSRANPDLKLMPKASLVDEIRELLKNHPRHSATSTWRLVIVGTVVLLEKYSRNQDLPKGSRLYNEILQFSSE